MIAFKLAKDKFDAWLRGVAGISAIELYKVAGNAVSVWLRDWFFGLDRTKPNQMGGKRTHFYADIARAVQRPQVNAEGVTIPINHVGLAQRWLGGTIKAGVGTSTATGGPTRWLAIPARSESYGRTPAEFSQAGQPLRFVKTRSGGAMLIAEAGGAEGRLRSEQGLAMFWLVKEVNQKPDPSVMPAEEEIAKVVGLSIEDYLAIKMSGHD